jgi:hypothetical protein
MGMKLHEIKKIREERDVDVVNLLLSKGWMLLAVYAGAYIIGSTDRDEIS